MNRHTSYLGVGDEVPQSDTLAAAVLDVQVGQNQPVDRRPSPQQSNRKVGGRVISRNSSFGGWYY